MDRTNGHEPPLPTKHEQVQERKTRDGKRGKKKAKGGNNEQKKRNVNCPKKNDQDEIKKSPHPDKRTRGPSQAFQSGVNKPNQTKGAGGKEKTLQKTSRHQKPCERIGTNNVRTQEGGGEKTIGRVTGKRKRSNETESRWGRKQPTNSDGPKTG